jgi:hypothetical protein
MKITAVVASLGALILCATPAQAVELITNGDFASGDFTGWTLFTTGPNGALGEPPAPRVTAFDVTGGGVSTAAEFQVGQIDTTELEEGGGLSQTITTSAGLLNFSASIAAFQLTDFTNVDGGSFFARLDGVTLDSEIFNTILFGEVLRGTLSFSTMVTAGDHLVEIVMTRDFRNGDSYGETPLQYLDNVSATQRAVPEPATWALMLAGFGGAGVMLRRRRLLAA